jgi:hypothetical protein
VRERSWWIATFACLAAIYASIAPAPAVVTALRERGWLGPSLELRVVRDRGALALRPGTAAGLLGSPSELVGCAPCGPVR